MKLRLILLTLVLLGFCAARLAALGGAAPGGALAITHVTVIDATGRPAQADQTVVVAEGRIAALGPSSRVKIPVAARVVNAAGKFLIPGLWDMHVHIAGINADPKWSKQVYPPLLIANGITGVRDIGGDLSALLASAGKRLPEQHPVKSAEEARAALRELKQQRADFIKIILLPSREAFFAVADEAKKQGLPFVGHVPAAVTASEASDAGMKSIEHIVYSGLAFDCSSRGVETPRNSWGAKRSLGRLLQACGPAWFCWTRTPSKPLPTQARFAP